MKVFLRENTSSHIVINAENWRKTDSLLLQYLISAACKWKMNGLSFALTNLAKRTADDFLLLGIEQETLSWKVAA